MDRKACRYRENIVSKNKKPLQNAIVDESFNNSREWSVLLKIVDHLIHFKFGKELKKEKANKKHKYTNTFFTNTHR